jgi:hypothetical protein
MPEEQEIPAPVTTTIFLHLATDKERSESVRLVDESVFWAAKSKVIIMLVATQQARVYAFLPNNACQWHVLILDAFD